MLFRLNNQCAEMDVLKLTDLRLVGPSSYVHRSFGCDEKRRKESPRSPPQLPSDTHQTPHLRYHPRPEFLNMSYRANFLDSLTNLFLYFFQPDFYDVSRYIHLGLSGLFWVLEVGFCSLYLRTCRISQKCRQSQCRTLSLHVEAQCRWMMSRLGELENFRSSIRHARRTQPSSPNKRNDTSSRIDHELSLESRPSIKLRPNSTLITLHERRDTYNN